MPENERAAARTLMIGLPGPRIDASLAARVARLDPAGVILFARNLETPEELAKLNRSLAGSLSGAPLIAIDQEGGRVSRLQRWIGPTPSASRLASMGDRSVEKFARLTGDAVRSLGFNVDFAPVVDLCDPDVENGIGDRSFGRSPDRTTRLARAYLAGLSTAGVAGCLKHFPGLGDTPVDSHHRLPTCPSTLEELVDRDLVPYRELGAEAPVVMVGHGHYPALTGEAPQPASGCRPIVSGLLREELGYEGLVASDDMQMGAVLDLDPAGEYAVRSMQAGCDLLLYCNDLDRAERARDALAALATRDGSFRERLVRAAEAIDKVGRDYPLPRPDLEAFEAARERLGRFSS